MKRCNACGEEFEDRFSFCPVDGTPMNTVPAAMTTFDHSRSEWTGRIPPEFKLTIISTTGLLVRLSNEARFLAREIKVAWPEFKAHPILFIQHHFSDLAARARRFLLVPNTLSAVTTALMFVLSAVLAVLLLGRGGTKFLDNEHPGISPEDVVTIDFSPSMPATGTGVGVSDRGRVGLTHGTGEGSGPRPQQSRGGGGGGNLDKLPPEQGKVPVPSAIQTAINPPLPHASLPAAGIDLDPALYRVLPFVNYGDPRSKSTVASKGPGDGGGIGTGHGTGIGEGRDGGFGPGSNGNTGSGPNARGCCGNSGADGNNPIPIRTVYPIKDVTERVHVTLKPEPQYTEEARTKQITGTVILTAIFSQSGEILNIRTVRPLPGGLTEKAIAAARQIRFVPAKVNGQPVSVYMQLEYNFNLY